MFLCDEVDPARLAEARHDLPGAVPNGDVLVRQPHDQSWKDVVRADGLQRVEHGEADGVRPCPEPALEGVQGPRGREPRQAEDHRPDGAAALRAEQGHDLLEVVVLGAQGGEGGDGPGGDVVVGVGQGGGDGLEGGLRALAHVALVAQVLEALPLLHGVACGKRRPQSRYRIVPRHGHQEVDGLAAPREVLLSDHVAQQLQHGLAADLLEHTRQRGSQLLVRRAEQLAQLGVLRDGGDGRDQGRKSGA